MNFTVRRGQKHLKIRKYKFGCKMDYAYICTDQAL